MSLNNEVFKNVLVQRWALWVYCDNNVDEGLTNYALNTVIVLQKISILFQKTANMNVLYLRINFQSTLWTLIFVSA